MTEGFVYFIRCIDRVKIGYSEDPARRLTKINSDAPFHCDLLGYVRAADFPERELHQRFDHLRLHSEWFAVTDELLTFVEQVRIAPPVTGDRFERQDLTEASPLLRWRCTAKVNQKDAAAKLGVHQSLWNRWETGRNRISAKHVLAVEALTGISRHDLRADVFGTPAAATEAA